MNELRLIHYLILYNIYIYLAIITVIYVTSTNYAKSFIKPFFEFFFFKLTIKGNFLSVYVEKNNFN